MKIAITGGTGFVGSHLARRLLSEGENVILLARGQRNEIEPTAADGKLHFVASDLTNPDQLADILQGCDAVAHCAGINREIGLQTYERVHVQSTKNIVEACLRAGIPKMVLMSFLRARPDCGSAYHESKWAAEEIVRSSALDFTIVKAGMVYGLGDHMLDHLSRSLSTLPVFATVGLNEEAIRPLAIEDLVAVLDSALRSSELAHKTVAITGPEQLLLSEAVRRVGTVINRNVLIVPSPVWVQHVLAQFFEWTMKVPLIAKAQVRILVEGGLQASGTVDSLPVHLQPTRTFTVEQIRKGTPAARPFGLDDLRLCR